MLVEAKSPTLAPKFSGDIAILVDWNSLDIFILALLYTWVDEYKSLEHKACIYLDSPLSSSYATLLKSNKPVGVGADMISLKSLTVNVTSTASGLLDLLKDRLLVPLDILRDVIIPKFIFCLPLKNMLHKKGDVCDLGPVDNGSMPAMIAANGI